MREIIEYLESILDLPEEECKIHLKTLISLLKYKDLDTEKVKQFKLEKVKRMINKKTLICYCIRDPFNEYTVIEESSSSAKLRDSFLKYLRDDYGGYISESTMSKLEEISSIEEIIERQYEIFGDGDYRFEILRGGRI